MWNATKSSLTRRKKSVYYQEKVEATHIPKEIAFILIISQINDNTFYSV